jgi:hypothetical protein
MEFMADHQIPRWINALCVVLWFCIVGSFVVVGVWRGYDFVQIIGFLAVYRFEILCLAGLVGLVLYGLSFLGRPHRGRKSH